MNFSNGNEICLIHIIVSGIGYIDFKYVGHMLNFYFEEIQGIRKIESLLIETRSSLYMNGTRF